jgi:hypothetical protein
MKNASLVAIALTAAACGSNTTTPSAATTTIVAGMNPLQSGLIRLSPATHPYVVPGGVLLLPGSGMVKVDVSATLAQREPYARLNVYLLTADGTYCAQNSPESPVWRDLEAGWSDQRSITGFRVYRLPCEVTGIRAMLHRRRDDHALTPPTAAETIVETTVPAQLLIRQD